MGEFQGVRGCPNNVIILYLFVEQHWPNMVWQYVMHFIYLDWVAPLVQDPPSAVLHH